MLLFYNNDFGENLFSSYFFECYFCIRSQLHDPGNFRNYFKLHTFKKWTKHFKTNRVKFRNYKLIILKRDVVLKKRRMYLLIEVIGFVLFEVNYLFIQLILIGFPYSLLFYKRISFLFSWSPLFVNFIYKNYNPAIFLPK